MSEKKYFWLKLDRNFFKRHDIRIIEEQENGKDYILFYLKLLVESIDHDGCLRFSESIPYNEKMLAVVTNTNIDIVRQAIKVFSELKMMQVLDDKTIYMCEVQKMIGSRTDAADRMKRHRENKQLIENKGDDVTCYNPLQKSYTEKEKELYKEQESELNTTCAFEKFYAAYPLKKSKAPARQKFEAAVKKQKIITVQALDVFTNMLIDAINKQATEKRLHKEAGKFCAEWALPSTWLNQERWNDDVNLQIAESQQPKQGNNAAQRMKDYGQLLKKKYIEECVKPKIGVIKNESK
jgi:predicted phage replisome organizer